MSSQPEVLYTDYHERLAILDPEIAHQRVSFMVALAENAAEWTPLNGPGPEQSTGLNFSTFKVFICWQIPELEQHEISSIAVQLENDIARFIHGTPLTKDAGFLDTVNASTGFAPTDVIAYGVHKIRETGLPFEGSAAESRIAGALDEHFLQLGLDVQAPVFAQLKQDTLLTV
jgi:hypothetical protein